MMLAASVNTSSEAFTPMDFATFLTNPLSSVAGTCLSLLKLPRDTFSNRISKVPAASPPCIACSALAPRAVRSITVSENACTPMLPSVVALPTFAAPLKAAALFPASMERDISPIDIPVLYRKAPTEPMSLATSCLAALALLVKRNAPVFVFMLLYGSSKYCMIELPALAIPPMNFCGTERMLARTSCSSANFADFSISSAVFIASSCLFLTSAAFSISFSVYPFSRRPFM
ncbi:MAG: hypothetical protein KH939_02180 [Firmicutes bacterium]|nr:hypothetical protein [Bacillota bacterium]